MCDNLEVSQILGKYLATWFAIVDSGTLRIAAAVQFKSELATLQVYDTTSSVLSHALRVHWPCVFVASSAGNKSGQ